MHVWASVGIGWGGKGVGHKVGSTKGVRKVQWLKWGDRRPSVGFSWGYR